MKRLLFMCGLLSLGSVQLASAQGYVDDRYATDNPPVIKRNVETADDRNEGTTSYLSYEDDISYASRINRFQRPMVSVGYWSGMYDPYWNMMNFGYPGMMYSPWNSWGMGMSWGFNSWYSPYSTWGWGGSPYWGGGFGFGGLGMGFGYGWGSPFSPWGMWGGYGWNHWGGHGHGYGPGYDRHPNRNSRGLSTGPRRTTTTGERPGSSNIRYDNGTRTRSVEGNRGHVRENNSGVRENRRNMDRNTAPSNVPRRNESISPRDNRMNSQPSRMNNSQPSRINNSQPSRSPSYSPSSSPSRGGSNMSAPSRSGGRGR